MLGNLFFQREDNSLNFPFMIFSKDSLLTYSEDFSTKIVFDSEELDNIFVRDEIDPSYGTHYRIALIDDKIYKLKFGVNYFIIEKAKEHKECTVEYLDEIKLLKDLQKKKLFKQLLFSFED